MINSTWDDVYYCSEVYDGTFTVDYNVLSGTGMFYDPTLTVLDSNYDHTFTYLYAYSSAQVLINHSSYTTVIFYELSNGTIDLSTFNNIQVLDNTTSAIFNTTIGVLRMSTNKTVNLENTTVVQLQKYYTFYQGIISGYNETFVGAESWAFPKVTVGPGTSITFIQYGYETYNQVNLTLRDTPECIEADLYDDTNGSIIRCNIGYFYANDYTLFNVTVINTTIQWGYVNDWANVTLSNCTVTSSISIQNYAFASFIDGCWVADLNLYNFAGNYTSADSAVVNFDDYT